METWDILVFYERYFESRCALASLFKLWLSLCTCETLISINMETKSLPIVRVCHQPDINIWPRSTRTDQQDIRSFFSSVRLHQIQKKEKRRKKTKNKQTKNNNNNRQTFLPLGPMESAGFSLPKLSAVQEDQWCWSAQNLAMTFTAISRQL